MKRIAIFITLLFCFGLGARADNVVSVSSTEGTPGEEVTVNIGLKNSDVVSSLQVSIPLNDELTLVEGSARKSNRCSDHSLTVGVKDSILNIFIYSLSMGAISGKSGEVVSLRLRLGSQPATTDIIPLKTVLTGCDGRTIKATVENGTVTTRTAKAEYSTMGIDFGRVPIHSTYNRTLTVRNVGNANLTITNIQFSDVNVFSSTTKLPLIITPGSSQQLNVTYAPVERGDIEKTLKVVCNSSSKLNTISLNAQPFAVNELHILPATGISDEQVTIGMKMNNMDAVSGYQVEFQLPEQLEYVDGSFQLSERCQNHTPIVSLNGNMLRIIVFSNNDSPFTGIDGEIGSFRVKLVGRKNVQLKPSKTVLSATINNKVENVVSEVYGAQVTIHSPQIIVNNKLDFGAVSVTEPCEQSFPIHNIGSAPLIVSRIVFNNEDLSVKKTLPLTIAAGKSGSLTVVYSSLIQNKFDATMQLYSNDPDMRLKEVNLTGSRFAPNYIQMTTPDIYTEDRLNVDIAVNAYDSIAALQFDLLYPVGYEPFDKNCIIEKCVEGMTVNTLQIGENKLRYFCYFLSDGFIAPNSGKIMSLQFQPIGGRMDEGNYSVYAKNIKLGTFAMDDKYMGTDTQSPFRVKVHNPVTITAKNYSRVYGEENPQFGYDSEGTAVIGMPSFSCEATLTSPIGEYPIIITKGGVENDEDTYVNGVLTITKAPLIIKADTLIKKQGEPNPELTLTYEGFKNGETKEVFLKVPVVTTTVNRESEPGKYAITVSGAKAENYEISYAAGELIVTEADPVTITAESYIREYGETNPTFEFIAEGAALDGTPEIICEAISTSPVGVYPIIIKKGDVTNYNDFYVNGTLTITKAPLKVSVKDVEREQGTENPQFEIIYEGWKLQDSESVLTRKPVATTTATKDSPVGEYVITVSGGQAENYELKYQDGKLTVTVPSSIGNVPNGRSFDVYSVSGVLVKKNVTTLKGLPKGVYIVEGKKVVTN